MNEEAKIMLYKQLVKIEENAKMRHDRVIEWEVFQKLEGKEVLKYTLGYRDRALAKVSQNKGIENADKKEFCIELPDMDLEDEDLSGVYLHNFRTGYAKERNSGKKIFVTTKINLRNTDCIINLATIHPIIISKDGINIQEISADIKKCDFRGCKVFGKFRNTKAKLIYSSRNLPREYIIRLEKFEVPSIISLTTDYMYIDMLDRKTIKGMNGIEKVTQIVDFDLTTLGKDIWKYRSVIKENNMDISYTGAFIEEYGFDSIGKENYYINLEARAKDAYQKGDMEYVEKVYEDLDKETKRNLVTLAFRDQKMEFVEKHQKELTALQKRYQEVQNQGMKINDLRIAIKDLLREEYRNRRKYKSWNRPYEHK